jgi:hypothetical protein
LAVVSSPKKLEENQRKKGNRYCVPRFFKPTDATITLNIDLAQMGVSGDIPGVTWAFPEYRLQPKAYRYAFTLEAVP